MGFKWFSLMGYWFSLVLIIPTKMRMPIMISSDNEKSCSLIFIPPVYTYNKNK